MKPSLKVILCTIKIATFPIFYMELDMIVLQIDLESESIRKLFFSKKKEISWFQISTWKD